MPKGEHLAEFNRNRADERRQVLENALTGPATATAVLDEPAPVEAPSIIDPNDEQEEAETEMLRAQNAALIEELKQARMALKANLPTGLPYPTAKAQISVDMPPNYVVWLGPDPLPGRDLSMSVKGRVGQITDMTPHEKRSTHGDGRAFIVSGTSHRGLTTEFINQGYTSLEFRYRCPANHKYAGKLWARLDCPEHAARLWITAPNGMGGDREHRPLFVFKFTLTDWKNKYEIMKKSRMQRRQTEMIEQEDVMENAVDMPEDITQPWQ